MATAAYCDIFVSFITRVQETRPRKSIPLDDITIEVADIGVDTECYFPLIYNRRNHIFFCQNAQMVEDWTRAICTGKLRQARHRAPEIDKQLSALEVCSGPCRRSSQQADAAIVINAYCCAYCCVGCLGRASYVLVQKRIQNHRMGRKLDYSFSFSSFYAEESGRVVRCPLLMHDHHHINANPPADV